MTSTRRPRSWQPRNRDGRRRAALLDVGPRHGVPGYTFVRKPEVGLVMVRGRAGGTGMQFNVGELPVARCSVRLDDGTVGHAYVGGRSLRHAEIAAVLDALLQSCEGRGDLETQVVTLNAG